MKYYLKYKLITGLSTRIFSESFETVDECRKRYYQILSAGYEVVEFGQLTKGDYETHNIS